MRATIWTRRRKCIRYEDKRYAWQVAEDTAHNLRVHWYQGGASFGQALRKTAVAGLDRLQANFGLTLTLPVEVWVYPDDTSFTSALPPNLPEWVGGKAFVQNGVVAALIDPSFDADHEIRRIVPHELSHLVVSGDAEPVQHPTRLAGRGPGDLQPGGPGQRDGGPA